MISLKPYKVKNLEVKNRIVMPPMCMYSADEEGYVQDFHKIHYGSRALGGLGLIIMEATAVEPKGRISDHDLGIWNDQHIQGLSEIVDLAHGQEAKIGIQLAHAGRKCTAQTDFTVSCSPLSYGKYRMPKELSKEEIDDLVLKFQRAAKRADEAGFDLVEIHAAHGYLIHQFLSPLSNNRTDAYGGSLENRARFLKEIASAIKKVWPSNKTISLRVSATDYLEGGLNIDETEEIIKLVGPFIDLVHVSTGGLLPAKIKLFDGYQVRYATELKKRLGLPTIAVGLINDLELAESIVAEGRADLVAMGRQILREPQFVLNEIWKHKYNYGFPDQYERAYRYRSQDQIKDL